MCYTAFVQNPENQFKAGWFQLVILAIQLSTNILIVIYSQVQNAILVGTYVYNYAIDYQAKAKEM
jgi:hypothetical protein